MITAGGAGKGIAMKGKIYKPNDDITLICGDARDYGSLELSARAGITDAPYKLTSGGKKPGHFQGGKMARYNNSGKPVVCDINWSEIMEVMDSYTAPQSDIFVMASAANENVFKAHAAAKAQGLRYHNNLQWDKGSPTRNRWGMRHLEDILYLYKGKAVRLNDCGLKQLIQVPRCRESNHPTAKPIDLMRILVRGVSQPGDLVVDPFFGGGSTAVACVLEGRKFTGFEIAPEHFEEACKRVNAAIRTKRIHDQLAVEVSA